MDQPDFKIRIPKPCHEDWDAMSPEERGRHCQKCSTVVRDFTQLTRMETQREIQSGESHCGRFRHDQLQSMGGGGLVAYQYPASRLRGFVVAFVLTFGFSSLSLEAEVLKELQPLERELRGLPMESLLAENRNQDSSSIMGTVLDALSGEPLEHAIIHAEWKGVVVQTTSTDSAGHFSLSIPKEYRPGLAIRVTLGETMILQENIPADVRELTVLLNSGITLPVVEVVGRRVEWERGERVSTGIYVGGDPDVSVGIIAMHSASCGHSKGDRYYHKLHDFIQMRNSEVFTKDY